jgi:iron(III) transport system permease protein
LTAAAKISGIMLLFLFIVIGVEKFSRRNQAVFERGASENNGPLYYLSGASSWTATFYCCMILFAGFLLPILILTSYAIDYFSDAFNSDAFFYAWQSLKIALIVSVICVVLSVLVNFYQRHANTRWSGIPGKISSTGYALPGTVLAIAVLLPLTTFDEHINIFAESTGWFEEPGLIFSGTIFALMFAYVVRFYAIAQGAIESSYARISPSLDMASHSMGVGKANTLKRVHLPLLKRGMFTAGLIVFIECMKELPAALLLRPFDFETLATYVYQYVSDEQLELASVSALFIVLVGLIPLYLVNNTMEAKASHE